MKRWRQCAVSVSAALLLVAAAREGWVRDDTQALAFYAEDLLRRTAQERSR